MKLQDMPEMLTAQHIASYLGISRQRVYELFQLHVEFGGIPSFDIGYSKRVDKQDFIRWIDSRKRDKNGTYLKAVR